MRSRPQNALAIAREAFESILQQLPEEVRP
jgi:hypothetical protein